jgi:putative SOS response-associated peptidase YedK
MALWLGGDTAQLDQIKALLRSQPAKDTTMWPVGPCVGNVNNNDPSLVWSVMPV